MQFPGSNYDNVRKPINFRLASVSRTAEAMTFVDGFLGYSPDGTNILERFFFARHQISSSALPLAGVSRVAFNNASCPVFTNRPDDPRLYPDSSMNTGFLDGHAKFLKRGKHQETLQQADGSFYWRYLAANR